MSLNKFQKTIIIYNLVTAVLAAWTAISSNDISGFSMLLVPMLLIPFAIFHFIYVLAQNCTDETINFRGLFFGLFSVVAVFFGAFFLDILAAMIIINIFDAVTK